jgi:GMP synthase (glutamine-hydrolysing)
LFKDEVRRVGKALGIKPELLGRSPVTRGQSWHPYPSDITPEKVCILQEADAIFIKGCDEWGLYTTKSGRLE